MRLSDGTAYGLSTIPAEQWRNQANCRNTPNPELFFPIPERGLLAAHHTREAQIRTATRICRHCPVKQQCLDYALNNHERYGIWGGLTEHQRALLPVKP